MEQVPYTSLNQQFTEVLALMDLEDKSIVDRGGELFGNFLVTALEAIKGDLFDFRRAIYDLLNPKKKTVDEIKAILACLMVTAGRLTSHIHYVDATDNNELAVRYCSRMSVLVGILQVFSLTLGNDVTAVASYLTSRIVNDPNENSEVYDLLAMMVSHILITSALLSDIVFGAESNILRN